MSIPTTRPSGTNFDSRRESQPAPHPMSRTLSVGARRIFSSTGSVMGRWSCSIPSPRPASAQRLNSSRRVSSDWNFVTRQPRADPLNSSATRTTEMHSRGRKRAALATKPPGADRNHPHRNIPLRGACPDQRNEPADDGPAEKQVHEENTHRIGLVPRKYRREEIHNRGEKQKSHVFTPFLRAWAGRGSPL